MNASRIDRDALLAELTPMRVVSALGITGRRAGDELRTKFCPTCGPRSRDAVAINLSSGRWLDHAHGCHGDLLALIAGAMGLDVVRDFRKVYDRAAEIAGMSPSSVRLEGRADRHRMAMAAQSARDKAARHRAEAAAPSQWARLARRSAIGEMYLRGRGLDSSELVARDAVRFTPNDDPAVALHALDTGTVVNVVTRRREPGDGPKVVGMRHCRTAGALVGRIGQLDPGGVDVAVVTEGVMDTLAAVLAFPGCVVVGAHGASRIAELATAAAARVVAVRGWMLFVPHVDGGTGERACADGVLAAMRAGLELEKSIHLVDVRPSKDLAEAWSTGWRWSWPS